MSSESSKRRPAIFTATADSRPLWRTPLAMRRAVMPSSQAVGSPVGIVGTRRGEHRHERGRHHVGHVGRFSQAPGGEPDRPVDVAAVEDLERRRIVVQPIQQLSVGRIDVHTCTWSSRPRAQRNRFLRLLAASAQSAVLGLRPV